MLAKDVLGQLKRMDMERLKRTWFQYAAAILCLW